MIPTGTAGATPGAVATNVPTNAVGILARIRTEQRRVAWLVDALERPRVPERVLTLLEDAQTALREAGEQLAWHIEHPMTELVDIVHGIHAGAAFTTCCQVPPFELPRWDRITAGNGNDGHPVTCPGKVKRS